MNVMKLPFLDKFNGKISKLTKEGSLLPKLDCGNKKNSISLCKELRNK